MQSLQTKSSRPKSFETETRPETLETETPKNGSRDRDQVSRLHHWWYAYKCTCIRMLLLIHVDKPIEAVTYNVIWDTHTTMCSWVTRVRLQVLYCKTKTFLIILLAARRTLAMQGPRAWSDWPMAQSTPVVLIPNFVTKKFEQTVFQGFASHKGYCTHNSRHHIY